MKKSIILLSAAALCCLACEKTNERFAPASTGAPVSNAILVEMEDGSEIPQNAVMSGWGLDNTRFPFTSVEKGSRATFAADVGQDIPEGIAYVLYPDVAVDVLNHGVFSVQLPAKQDAGSPSACIYAGHVVNNKATLQKMCGLISFTLNQSNVATVEISASAPISGHAKLSMAATPVISAEVDGEKTVSLTGVLENGQAYSLAALPGTYSDFAVRLRNASGRQIFSKKFTEPVTVSPAEPLELGLVGEPDKPLEPGDRVAIGECFVAGESEIEFAWAAGCGINVFAGADNEKFVLKNGAGTSTGTFHGKEIAGAVDCALYPYDADATFAAGAVTTTLSAAQRLGVSTEDTVENDSMIAVGYDDGEIIFKNVCALLKFSIKGDNIGEVVISGNADEDLAGKISVTIKDGVPAYTVLEGAKSLSLKPADGVAFKPGIYCAAVLPQDFAGGISVKMVSAVYMTDAVVKRVFRPAELSRSITGDVKPGRSSVTDLGLIDANVVWNYSNLVTMAALRGSKQDSGCYIDFSTGRTFYAIGSYAYSDVIDAAIISNTANGVAPTSITTVGGFTNDTNLGKFGTCTSADYVANWPVRLGAKFCYVSAAELSDAQYDALTTVQDIKAIYDAHEADAVNSYYTPTPNCITNANKVNDHKYFVVKTYRAAEGAGYGIVKINGIAGATWYVQFYYKYGLETTTN